MPESIKLGNVVHADHAHHDPLTRDQRWQYAFGLPLHICSAPLDHAASPISSVVSPQDLVGPLRHDRSRIARS